MDKFPVVILDFDGVVLESVEAKGEAFVALFSEHDGYATAVADFHRRHGGVPRRQKIERIYREVLRIEPTAQLIDAAVARFGSLVVDRVLACDFVPGALEFLDRQSAVRRIYVASATPTDELRDIVRRRALDQYLKGVFGTPRAKSAIVSEIIALNEIEPRNALVVGDALEDLEAARATGATFVGRSGSPGHPFTDRDGMAHLVPDLVALDQWLSVQSR